MSLKPAQQKQLRQSPVKPGGNRVAAAVELADITLVQLAEGTSLPYTYVADVASQRYQTITVQNAHKFAEFFGVPIEDLWPAEAVAS